MDGNEFRSAAVESFAFLEERGFRRAPQFDRTTVMSATVVYTGITVALVFHFDVRDQATGADVVMFRDGKLAYNADGGYSTSLFLHLRAHGGYKRPTDQQKPSSSIPEKLNHLARTLQNCDLSVLEPLRYART
jgi:hypothetical protein